MSVSTAQTLNKSLSVSLHARQIFFKPALRSDCPSSAEVKCFAVEARLNTVSGVTGSRLSAK